MSIFKLPDLGEGLPDAEIHEWFVKEGDTVTLDQPLVAMETAKAVVDVPSPQAGIIEKLFGKSGDVIPTGSPLVAFKEEHKAEEQKAGAVKTDQGTVVGKLEESHEVSEDNFIIGSSSSSSSNSGAKIREGRAKATPMVRQLAKKLQVDLNMLSGSGEHGLITREDVESAAKTHAQDTSSIKSLEEGYEPLRGSRRSMLQSMVQSHKEVVPVSLFDEVDIQAWGNEEDITARLIHAIVKGCQEEPALNAWFNSEASAKKTFNTINLGLAMDTEDGLFVPVIHHAETYNPSQLREIINEYKAAMRARTLKPEAFKGGTITLSNFGKFAGRYASPIIVPPMVAIVAVGRLYEAPALEKETNTIQMHRFLPLSLSFDHRAVTGGEATRFLGIVMQALQAKA
jgi:pyruvate dehydrogenase E2 component (dihydrolipoamide acetyltransferase)